MGGAQAALEAAAGALLLLPTDQVVDPSLGLDGWPVGEQTIQAEGFGAGVQGVEVIHRCAP
jgi:hypothetical protein